MARALLTPFLLALLFVSEPSFGQEKTTAAERWTDYIAGEYDLLPNITYAVASGTQLKLDLYLPKGRSTPAPTLVLYHGGGWVAGEKERNVLWLLPYLHQGFAVVNVEYRLARVAPAPAAVEDCRCALRWVVTHARDYSLDTSRIVLTGTSAGGHLALITGMLPPGTPFDRQCPSEESARWISGREPEGRVAAVVSWFGITDVGELLDGPDAKHYAIEWFGALDNRKELARQLSPLTYVRPGLPPVITLHGDKDNVVPYHQAVRLHDALDKAGVRHQLVTVQGAGHGGFNREQMLRSYAAVWEFLRKNGVLRAPEGDGSVSK